MLAQIPKNLCLLSACFILSSCGHSLVSPRSTNPLMKDRIGLVGGNEMYALSSRADRRTILIMGENRVCAEPPPDVAETVFSELSAEAAKENKLSAEFGSTLQTAVLQLTRRSQGLDYFRTGSFVYCMMYSNGDFGAGDEAKKAYHLAMSKLLDASMKMTIAEIEELPTISSAIVQVAKSHENSSNEGDPE